VIDELEDTPSLEAETAIADARRKTTQSGPDGVAEFQS